MARLSDLFRKKDKVDDTVLSSEAHPSATSAAGADTTEQDHSHPRPSTPQLNVTLHDQPQTPSPSPPSHHLDIPKRSSRLTSPFRPRTPSASREQQDLLAVQSIPGTAKSPGDTAKRLSARLEKIHLRSVSGFSTLRSLGAEMDVSGTDGEIDWVRRAVVLADRAWSMNVAMGVLEGGVRSVDGAEADAEAGIDGTSEDELLQQAIRLHEAGDLTRATTLLGHLATIPSTPSPSAQILYSLSLRHGWGVPPSPILSFSFLCRAAHSSATTISSSLPSPPSTESVRSLRMALHELASSFRFGLGVERDPIAARAYYETAASLGDLDAMENAAWCLLHGFGGEKNKKGAAGFLRRREKEGKGTELGVGESWIWKKKYDP